MDRYTRLQSRFFRAATTRLRLRTGGPHDMKTVVCMVLFSVGLWAQATDTAAGKYAKDEQGRMRGTWSVLDFPGCDPTGKTDSSACIMAAWNASGTDSKGGTLNVPCGTFQIAAKITLTSFLAHSLLGS